jgi:16S rRNA (cytidine1402-2'-O)-methyltransferase
MKLYIVSTPIGNLKDITLRALDILKEVDFIACEDTRVTGILLNHYEIKKEMISFNARTETAKIDYVLGRVRSGENAALVSDAGTPAISDPGIRLISAAIRSGVELEIVPGASAAIAAVTLSGFPTNSFVFEGFIPQKKGRQKKLAALTEEKRTVILYESAYRIEKLIKELSEYMPERQIAVCRELTKKFEEVWRGTPKELMESLSKKVIKGEFAVVISPLEWQEPEEED